ncbi:MAG TPA: hydroxysqualene dehydroxylase HpnE [Bacteroidota bacterium]|nr:hydroxysqualene dehydroxylase HpnE [Bacteroidota bacterium]
MQLPARSAPDVVVIGGGVSGLTAAVSLAGSGYSVCLIEQKQHCGGRTYSFVERATGDEVDNGQHLMMGCYHSTLNYLAAIGAMPLVSVQERLSVSFRHADRGLFRLRSAALPPPLNILAGLLRLKSLSFSQRLSLLRVGTALLSAKPDSDENLRAQTVTQWLDTLGQSKENKEYLWDILAIGTLNDSPDVVSAALFIKVLQSAFLGKKRDSSMVIPKRGLSVVLVDNAVEFLERNGGRVLTETTVERAELDGMQISKLELNSGAAVSPRAVVSAVPYFDLPRVFGGGTSAVLPETSSAGSFISSPIVTIHLWFDRSFVDEDFTALLDSPIHWVFNKSRIFEKESGGDYLSLVISGAGDFIAKEKEELLALALSELRRFYPACGRASLVHSLVVKEKRATFSPRVGTESVRPSHATSVRNLFLAGDWTDTKLPATIEGAAQSGYRCGALVRKFLEGASGDSAR